MMSVARINVIKQILTVISNKDIDDWEINRECRVIKCINDLFSSLYEPREHLALGEGMMAFERRMKNRIYSPLNPDRWEMKFYILAGSELGYILKMRICGQKWNLENTDLDLTGMWKIKIEDYLQIITTTPLVQQHNLIQEKFVPVEHWGITEKDLKICLQSKKLLQKAKSKVLKKWSRSFNLER